MHWFTFRSLEHGYFYLFIYFQFLRRCFKDANVSTIIQNPMEKPVGFLSREPRATLPGWPTNIRHPSTTLYCKNTCSSWMIMHEFILYSAVVFIERGGHTSLLAKDPDLCVGYVCPLHNPAHTLVFNSSDCVFKKIKQYILHPNCFCGGFWK